MHEKKGKEKIMEFPATERMSGAGIFYVEIFKLTSR